MKMWKTGAALVMASLLASCGGGGGAPGDVTTFNVDPSGRTWLASTCPAGVADAVSFHTIIGGQEPFIVRPTDLGLEVGLLDASRNFVEVPLVNGNLILRGRNPEFAVRATLGCGSEVTVLVLDEFARSASVTIKVEEQN